MQGETLREWLDSRGTKLLLAYLRRRKTGAVQTFLAGQPVETLAQGRAAALHELETLLTGSPDKLKEVFETALKETKAP